MAPLKKSKSLSKRSKALLKGAVAPLKKAVALLKRVVTLYMNYMKHEDRLETVWSISSVGVRVLRGFEFSTRGPFQSSQ